MRTQPKALRIALFVEGSEAAASRRRDDLSSLWRTLCTTIGAMEPSIVFPISKKHLVAMDQGTARAGRRPAISGASEGLDDFFKRQLTNTPFDTAIVAWDLAPPWATNSAGCRWQETIDLYASMERRARLPEPFLSWVRSRYQELLSRQNAQARPRPLRLQPGAILPLCMETSLESWFIDERNGRLGNDNCLRNALSVRGRKVRDWPASLTLGDRRSAKDYLVAAIVAAQRLRPLPEEIKRVRGGWDTNQEGWGHYLASALSKHCAETWQSHPIAVRLAELLSASR